MQGRCASILNLGHVKPTLPLAAGKTLTVTGSASAGVAIGLKGCGTVSAIAAYYVTLRN